MIRTIERLRVWVGVRLGWRSKSRLREVLRNFSATEADSAWQIHQVLPHVTEPSRRAELFEHILEEMHHADEFQRLYGLVADGRPFLPVKTERQPVWRGQEDPWKFFAYCEVGEEAAFRRFGDIARALPPGPFRKTLKRILRDEAGHVHGAQEALEEFGVSAKTARREIRRIRRRRFREGWVRMGRRMTDHVSVLILSVLYLLVAPIGRGTARRRLNGLQVREKGPGQIQAGSLQIVERGV